MSVNTLDRDAFCRLCAIEGKAKISVFDEVGCKKKLLSKIAECLPVTVSKEDKLPKFICNRCCNKLEHLYEFRLSTVRAESTLNTILGASSTVIRNEIEVSSNMKVSFDRCSSNGHRRSQIDSVDRANNEESDWRNDPKLLELECRVILSRCDTLISDNGLCEDGYQFVCCDFRVNAENSERDENNRFEAGSDQVEAWGPGELNDNNDPLASDDKKYVVKMINEQQPTTLSFCDSKIKLEKKCALKLYEHRTTSKENAPVEQTSKGYQMNKDQNDASRSEPLNETEEDIYFDNSYLEQHVSKQALLKVKRSYKARKCIECGEELMARGLQGVWIHMWKKHKVARFTCPMCGKGYPYSCNLRDHLGRHRGERTFSCFECGKEYFTKYVLGKHYEREHGKPFPRSAYDHSKEQCFECDVCKRTFGNKRRLYRHIQGHDKTPVSCKKCGKLYTKGSLIKHLRRCLSEKRKLFQYELSSKEGVPLDNCVSNGQQNLETTESVDELGLQMGETIFIKSKSSEVVEDANVQQLTHQATEHSTNEANPTSRRVDLIESEHTKKNASSLCVTDNSGNSSNIEKSNRDISCSVQEGSNESSVGEPSENIRENRNESSELQYEFRKAVLEGNEASMGVRNDKEFVATGVNVIGTHMLGMHNIDVLMCGTCGKRFRERSTLTQHLQRVHGERKFPCPICAKRFVTNYGLNRHYMVHEKQYMFGVLTIQEFTCETCGKTFHEKSSLKQHIEKVHGERQFSCSKCDSKFVHKYDLNKHYYRMHEKRDMLAVFTCPVCNKRFHKNDSLIQHIKKVHTERRFSCPLCESNFFYKSDLNRHYTTVHQREHKKQEMWDVHSIQCFTCELCGLVFRKKRLLRQHVVRAHGERRFACNQCPVAFAFRSALIRHCKMHEKKDWDVNSIAWYICESCGRGFPKRRLLTNHRYRAHAERRFSCPKCNSKFVAMCYLKLHYNTVHEKSDNKNPLKGNTLAVQCVSEKVQVQNEVANPDLDSSSHSGGGGHFIENSLVPT